jgi:hypothetical protein
MKRKVRTIEFSWEETQRLEINAQSNTSEIITARSDEDPADDAEIDDREVDDHGRDRLMLP